MLISTQGVKNQLALKNTYKHVEIFFWVFTNDSFLNSYVDTKKKPVTTYKTIPNNLMIIKVR